APVVAGHYQDAPAERGQVVGAAAAWKANLGPRVVGADHGRVEVAVGINLSAAQEGVVDHAALAGFHDVGHAGGHDAAPESARVADADRHGRQLGGDAPGLKEDHQVGGAGALGQHGSGTGYSGANGDSAAILQSPAGAADHQLHGAVRYTHLSPRQLVGA